MDAAGAQARADVKPLKLPRAGDAPVPALVVSRSVTDSPLFELLVENDADVTGLVAYGLYKQSKRDWKMAFAADHNRAPDATETEAFVIGERLPRRIAAYRKAAEEMLQRNGRAAGRRVGDDIRGPQPEPRGAPAQPVKPPAAIVWRNIILMLLLLVVMAAAFRFAGTWLFR